MTHVPPLRQQLFSTELPSPWTDTEIKRKKNGQSTMIGTYSEAIKKGHFGSQENGIMIVK